MAEIKASGQITIVDLSDSRQLTMYLTSSLPKTQIYDTDGNKYMPDWAESASPLIITANAYLDQQAITDNITYEFYPRDGANAMGSKLETDLDKGIRVDGDTLTITKNILGGSTSNMMTYICRTTYTDPVTSVEKTIEADITFSLVKNPSSTKMITISGEQVFKYSQTEDGNFQAQPGAIILTAHMQNVGAIKWQYKNKGTTDSYTDISGATGTTLEVNPNHAAFQETETATFRAISKDYSYVFDIFSVHKLYDGEKGSNGAAAVSAIVSNEAIMIPAEADEDNLISTTTTIKVTLSTYKGTTPAAHTIESVAVGAENIGSEYPSGSATTRTITLTFDGGKTPSVKNSEGQSVAVNNGTIVIRCKVDGQDITKEISWAKAIRGVSGSNGKNAIVFSVYAPQGEVVENQSGQLKLKAQGYDGTDLISSGYQWYVFNGSDFVAIAGKTGQELDVYGVDIVNIATYKCILHYNDKDYEDVITITDKSDTLFAIISSTGGSVFKNGQGSSILTCKLMANGKEVDPLITDNIVTNTNQVANPTNGTYCYLVNTTTGTATLQKYNGSSWTNANDKTQIYNYVWSAINSNGETNEPNPSFSKTGKVIYVDGDDVNIKTTFTCNVNK